MIPRDGERGIETVGPGGSDDSIYQVAHLGVGGLWFLSMEAGYQGADGEDRGRWGTREQWMEAGYKGAGGEDGRGRQQTQAWSEGLGGWVEGLGMRV